MEILPGVGAMGAVPPAKMGMHRLGGGMYLRTDEVPMRDVMLQFTMTSQGPKLSEVSPDTGKPVRTIPKAEALEIMRQITVSLRTPPPPSTESGAEE